MSRRAADEDVVRVRMNFKLSAPDNPLLVGELLSLPKGKLRHARLVTLATIGLLTESQAVTGEMRPATSVGGHACDERRDGRRLADFTEELLNDVEVPERG